MSYREGVAECLDELRNEYDQSPVPSRCNIELTFDDNTSNTNHDSDDGPGTPKTIRRISVVEECIYEVLHLEEGSMRGMLKQVPVSPMARAKPLKLDEHQQHYWYPCKDTYNTLPSHPSEWPQRPLMIRPTPYTSTKILGIRRASSDEYQHFSPFCSGCILPINNGKEMAGESLVIDFESTYFVGTMLLRIKQAPDHRHENVSQYYHNSSYFDGKKRKFQTVVRGRFKEPLSMSQCVTGQAFQRPAGKLPARILVTAFIKFISQIQPQLEATLDGDKPRFLTPLVATAHTVLSLPASGDEQLPRNYDVETPIEEPSSVEAISVMPQVLDNGDVSVPDTSNYSVASRMKARKKVFNALAAKKSPEPRFDTSKEYCFEFYQHLLDFGEELAVDMGRVGGKVGLAQATDGQPLKILAAYRDHARRELDTLWSFDIWHESLYPFAEKAQHAEK